MPRRELVGRGAATAAALFLFVWLSPSARAGPPEPVWAKTLAIDVRSGSVAVDRAGDVYVTGSRGTDVTETVAVLKKFGPDGEPLWTRSWSPRGAGAHADGELVAVTRDGSVYFGGSVGSHFEGGAWFLRRYAPDGTLEWARDEPGWRHGRTADHPSGLAVTRHEVLLAGSFQGCCGDLRIRDGWVLAFGTDGHRRWRSPFEATGLGAFSDQAEGIAVGAGGRIYVAGWAALGSENDEIAADHELFLQALDAGGSVIWSRTYPATAWLDQDFGTDVVVHGRTLTVSALVGGSPVGFGPRPGQAWLGRFTLDGDLRWSRTWGASTPTAAAPSAIGVGAAGRTFVVGTRRDPSDHGLDGFLRAYSYAGEFLWRLRLPDAERLVQGVDVAWRDGGLSVAAGASRTRFGPALHGDLWRFAKP